MSDSITTKRDLRLIRLDRRNVLAVSCDSSGGIGSKQLDQVRCSPYTVGKFAARVALMEVLAVRAIPICIAAPLAVERQSTGNDIIKGVRSEIKTAGLDVRTPLIDSTEKNFQVSQTGVGVTVIGLADASRLKVGRCVANDQIFAVGFPLVGAEVLTGQRRGNIADIRDLIKLVELSFIREVIPVGSRGILYEARVLARDSRLRFEPENNLPIDLAKSAGPATVVLFACSKTRDLAEHFPKPITRVGSLAE